MPEKFVLSPLAKKSCEHCPLKRSRFVSKQVPTEVYPLQHHKGSMADVMFIAEAPGRVENETGRPFVGGTGKILRQLVYRINEDKQLGVAYGNIVRCRPVDETDGYKDRPPTRKERETCKENILNDITKINPRYIVLLGKSAAVGLAHDRITGKPISADSKVFNLRGKEYVVRTPDGKEYPAIITFHFAFVSRMPNTGGVFEEDIRRAFYRARGQISDYSKRGEPTIVVDTVPRVRALLKHMATKLDPDDVVALDYETTGLARVGNRILTIGFAWDEDRGYVIPYKHPDSPWSGKEFKEVRRLLKKFFTLKKVPFRSLIAHNLKFECAVTLDEWGIPLWNLPLECTLLRAHAINENRKKVLQEPFKLKPMSDEVLCFKGYEDGDVVPVVEKRGKGQLIDVPLGPLCEYNGMDCYVEVRLFNAQEEWARAVGYDQALRLLGLHMHGPASMFAARMERNGTKINKKYLEYLMSNRSPIVGRLFEIEKAMLASPNVQKANKIQLGQVNKTRGMRGIWGKQAKDPVIWHINRPASRQALFVDVLGLETEFTDKGKPKFDKSFWKANKGIMEIDLTAEWVALDKLRGTYVDAPYKMLRTSPEMQDGRIRGQFHFHNTRTGRTSSDNPNMQNIPKGKTVTALAVKRIYTVEERHLMVCADYSQAEVRWLAQMTGDEYLINAFKAVAKVQEAYLKNPTPKNFKRMLKEGDFHRQTAGQIFGKPPEKISDLERGSAKAIVFGLIYGMSTFGLAAGLGIPYDQAEEYRNKFLNQFPEAKAWLYKMESTGFTQGYVDAPNGRRRHLVSGFVVTDDNEFFEANGRKMPTNIGKYRQYEDRVCRNAPIQVIASDTNLRACFAIQKFIEKYQKPWKLLITVHDSIIAEIPREDVIEYMDVAQRIMEDPKIFEPFGIEMTVPFVADFSIGSNWADQTDIDITEKYVVKCKECGTERKEEQRTKNRRCEECGSRKIEEFPKKAPLEIALKYWDWKLGYKPSN